MTGLLGLAAMVASGLLCEWLDQRCRAKERRRRGFEVITSRRGGEVG